MSDNLPSSVHTETVILGAMLLDSVAISDATAKLRPEDFSLDSHQRIYRTILELLAVGHAVDYVTVADELQKRHELEAIGGREYLAFVTEGVPRHINIESYVRIVKDKSLLRQLMVIFSDGMNQASDQTEAAARVLADVEERLAAVADSSIDGEPVRVADALRSFPNVDSIFEAQAGAGVATGYADVDSMTRGLQPSELAIIAARPSMGKTALALNIAENCSSSGAVVLVLSMEMSKEALIRRLVCTRARVGIRALDRGFCSQSDRAKLVGALDALLSERLFIDDSAHMTIPTVRAKARRILQQQGKLDLIVVDYLQLMASERRPENRTLEVSAISRGLKALAKELKVPVVALSQLSRASEQRSGDKRPMLSDLRESGAIEQDADLVAFIHRPEYYDRENVELQGKAEIIIAKQRNGPTGVVKLAYIAECTRFENYIEAY